jgi:hypothetical protein
MKIKFGNKLMLLYMALLAWAIPGNIVFNNITFWFIWDMGASLLIIILMIVHDIFKTKKKYEN